MSTEGAILPPALRTPSQMSRPGVLTQVEEVLHRTAAGGAIVAAATHGIAQYALDQYYGAFGMTPRCWRHTSRARSTSRDCSRRIGCPVGAQDHGR